VFSYCLPKLITLSSPYCISKLTTKHSKNTKMQYNFSTEFFHLILNKFLVCALINEDKLVIVKTNQENQIVFDLHRLYKSLGRIRSFRNWRNSQHRSHRSFRNVSRLAQTGQSLSRLAEIGQNLSRLVKLIQNTFSLTKIIQNMPRLAERV